MCGNANVQLGLGKKFRKKVSDNIHLILGSGLNEIKFPTEIDEYPY